MQHKFRVFHKELNRFITKDEWFLNLDCELYFFDDAECLIKCRKDLYIIQQFTGLKTLGGVEIYEGDILKYSPDYNESQGGQICPTIGAVEFLDGGYFAWTGDLLCEHGGIGDSLCLEIIGNIFENPELLK